MNPCTIERAVEVVAVSGDDVTLRPGTYNLTDDLTFLETSFGAITVHGAPGARPQINVALSAPTIAGVVVRGTIRDVTIVETGSSPTQLLQVEQSTDLAERVFVHATLDNTVACDVSGTIRDSVCWAEGDGAVAARISRGPTFSGTATLRNVTAIASGTGGVGVQAGAGGANSNATLNGRNVIARGAGFDAEAVGGGTSATVDLDFSNYETQNEVGNGTVTDPGTLNNETADPVFRDAANGDFHQTGASGGTTDQGTDTVALGAFDIDGQTRDLGANPDIGADELANGTTTGVTCSPSSLVVGSGGSNCTVTVTDTSPSPDTPSGIVNLSGASGVGGNCTLMMVSGSQASCPVTYTPTGAGLQQVTAAYPGDNLHDPSQGTAVLAVAASSAPPTLAPQAPTATPPKKKRCKKGRKLKKGKCVKKKRK